MTEQFMQQTAFKVEECTDRQAPQIWISLRFQCASETRKARLAQYKARLRHPQKNDYAIFFSAIVLVFFLLLELTNPAAAQTLQKESTPIPTIAQVSQRHL